MDSGIYWFDLSYDVFIFFCSCHHNRCLFHMKGISSDFVVVPYRICDMIGVSSDSFPNLEIHDVLFHEVKTTPLPMWLQLQLRHHMRRLLLLPWNPLHKINNKHDDIKIKNLFNLILENRTCFHYSYAMLYWKCRSMDYRLKIKTKWIKSL